MPLLPVPLSPNKHGKTKSNKRTVLKIKAWFLSNPGSASLNTFSRSLKHSLRPGRQTAILSFAYLYQIKKEECLCMFSLQSCMSLGMVSLSVFWDTRKTFNFKHLHLKEYSEVVYISLFLSFLNNRFEYNLLPVWNCLDAVSKWCFRVWRNINTTLCTLKHMCRWIWSWAQAASLYRFAAQSL